MGAHRNNFCVNKPKIEVGISEHGMIPANFFGEVRVHSLKKSRAEVDAEN